MTELLFKIVLAVVAIAVVLVLLRRVEQNARRLDRRITEFKAEQEELKAQGKSINPYAALAELYTTDNDQK